MISTSSSWRNISESQPLLDNNVTGNRHCRDEDLYSEITMESDQDKLNTVVPVPSQDDGRTSSMRKCLNITRMEIYFLLIVTAVEFGCNMTLDLPGALQNALIKNYHLTAAEYALFYSLYYVPTILLNAFSGFLIDSVMGIKLSTLVNVIIAIIGCALFSLGGVVNMYWLMLMGRLVFGLGNELATGVCVNYCMFSWYRNSVVNFMSCLFVNGAMAGTLLMYQIGPRGIELLKKSMPEKEALNIVIILASATFIITGALAILMTYMKPKDSTFQSNTSVSAVESISEPVEEKKASLRDILEFPFTFWLLCGISVLTSSGGCFQQFSQGFLTTEFNLTVDEASNAVTVMEMVNILLALPVSLSVDFMGRNTWYIIAAQGFAMLAHIMFAFSVNPYACMTMVGLSASINQSAILPMYAYPVKKHLVGSCYGIISTLGGLTNATIPYLVGKLIDNYGYRAAILFFLASASTSMVNILVVWYLDKRSTGLLSMTPSQRIKYEQQINMKQTENLEIRSTTSELPVPGDSESLEYSSDDFSSTAYLTKNGK